MDMEDTVREIITLIIQTILAFSDRLHPGLQK